MYINDRLCSPMISRFPTFLSTIIYLGGDRMTIRHPKKLFAQCGNMLNWDPYIIAVTLNSNHLSLCWQAVISWNQASPSKKHPSKPVLIFYGAGSRKMPKSKARFPHHVDEIPRFSTNPHRGNCEICTLQCNKSTGKWYKSLNPPFFCLFAGEISIRSHEITMFRWRPPAGGIGACSDLAGFHSLMNLAGECSSCNFGSCSIVIC